MFFIFVACFQEVTYFGLWGPWATCNACGAWSDQRARLLQDSTRVSSEYLAGRAVALQDSSIELAQFLGERYNIILYIGVSFHASSLLI